MKRAAHIHLTCLSQFAIPGCEGPVIIEQWHQSWLLIRVKRLVKESKLIEKLRSQHQQTMRFRPSLVTGQHARCSLVISHVGNQARKSQANAWQCLVYRGLVKKLPITCLSKMFIFRAQHRGAALSDNTAPKIFHIERQTHVRHTLPYRLYHHYFLEYIKKNRLMTSIVNQY